jgi:hypothetical protein
MHSIYCELEIPFSTTEELIVNPILNYYTFLKKRERRIIYGNFFKGSINIYTQIYSCPVYLPEVCGLLSLDITSRNLVKDFLDKMREYESFYSKNQIMCSRLYNFDRSFNRAVSWGQYKFFTVNEKIYDLYITNLINDLLFSPSIVTHYAAYSPNRWFHLSETLPVTFSSNINYNVGIVYLKKNEIDRAKKVTLWINQPVEVYEIEGGVIRLSDNGFVEMKKFPLYFTEEPFRIKEEIADKGDYFRCFMVSFNEYKTNHKKFVYSEGTKVNIVDSLIGLVHSPYDILPFILPYKMDQVAFNSSVYNWEVEKYVFDAILKRFSKFCQLQSGEWIENYNKIFEERNSLFKIIQTQEGFKVKMINPSIIPFLIRKSIGKDLYGKYANKVLKDEKLFQRLEEWERNKGGDFELNVALHAFGRVNKCRSVQLKNYLEALKNVTQLTSN